MSRAAPDAKSPPALTNPQELRLELLRLTYRHDRTPADIATRASELEQYVRAGQAPRPAAGEIGKPADGPI